MAKIKLNPVVEKIHGDIGDLVFRSLAGKMIAQRKPEATDREPTVKQAAQHEQFRRAVAYGRIVQADAETKAIYEAAAKSKGIPAFALSVADFLNAPTVDELDLSTYGGAKGDLIHISTHDDMEVVGVHVNIAAASGAELEKGDAVLDPAAGRWTYTAQSAVASGQVVRIQVTANDRPGGSATKQEDKTL